MVQPTRNILLKFIKETFTYKGPSPEKLPINDFIKHYDKKWGKVDRGWLKKIVGNLTPFITFLSSGFANQNDNIETSITFFESKLYSIPSKYNQIKKDLITAVRISLQNRTGGLHRHPLYIFLTADHEVKRKYDKGDWLYSALQYHLYYTRR